MEGHSCEGGVGEIVPRPGWLAYPLCDFRVYPHFIWAAPLPGELHDRACAVRPLHCFSLGIKNTAPGIFQGNSIYFSWGVEMIITNERFGQKRRPGQAALGSQTRSRS